MKIWHTFYYIGQRFFADDCANRTPSLAYTALLSLVPVMMMSFWILSLFPIFAGTEQALQNFVLTNFVADSATVIAKHLNYFLEQISVLSWTNLMFLTVIGTLMIFDMVRAFNGIWHVKVTGNFALSFFFYVIAVLFTPILLGVLVVVSSHLASVPYIAQIIHISFWEVILLYALPYLVAFVTFTFFNWALPSCTVPLRNAAMAGFVTTFLFECAKYAFTFYLSYLSPYKLIYGALATIPIFLLWIYLTWVVILVGAVVCNVLTNGIPKNNPS